MNTSDQISFMISHIEKETEAKERKKQFSQVTPILIEDVEIYEEVDEPLEILTIDESADLSSQDKKND